MFKNLKVKDRVVISIVPGKKVEIWEIADLSARVIIAKSLSRQETYREFNRETGFSIGGERLLQEYDLAVNKAPEIECPHCKVSQRNFFMAGEYLRGKKRFFCHNCDKPLFLYIDGRFFAIRGTPYIKCPDCKTPQWLHLTALEIARGGGNRKCYKCQEIIEASERMGSVQLKEHLHGIGFEDIKKPLELGNLLWVDTKGGVKKVLPPKE